jgi:hypothetical protein
MLVFEDFPKNHNLILIAQPELISKLNLSVNDDLRSRITYSILLQGLTPHNVIQSFCSNSTRWRSVTRPAEASSSVSSAGSESRLVAARLEKTAINFARMAKLAFISHLRPLTNFQTEPSVSEQAR